MLCPLAYNVLRSGPVGTHRLKCETESGHSWFSLFLLFMERVLVWAGYCWSVLLIFAPVQIAEENVGKAQTLALQVLADLVLQIECCYFPSAVRFGQCSLVTHGNFARLIFWVALTSMELTAWSQSCAL